MNIIKKEEKEEKQPKRWRLNLFLMVFVGFKPFGIYRKLSIL
jgi:sugar phosphate permease